MNDLQARPFPRNRLSAISQESDVRPTSPGARSLRSVSSTSTLDSVGFDSAPPLPAVVCVRECSLRRKSVSAGWGFTLRGTKSELGRNEWMYNCFVEAVSESGAAAMAGMKEGDQILCIDGTPVNSMEHSNVVKLFQSSERIKITVLPFKFKACNHIRVTKLNKAAIDYLWAFVRHLQVLEIINVNLGDDGNGCRKVQLMGLSSIRSLSLNHCSISSLECLEGLYMLHKLETLSLAHNLLQADTLTGSHLPSLSQLKKLDLGHNLLNQVPLILCEIQMLEVLVLGDNSISELPISLIRLEKLHTLCVDGNLLHDVDKVVSRMPQLQKLTAANNSLECESQVVKVREFLVASIEANPFNCPNEKGIVSRNEPSLRRTLSVRGSILNTKQAQRHSLDWDVKSNTAAVGIAISIDDYSDYKTQ